MFKCVLLATTAIVLIGTLSFFAAQSAAFAQPLTTDPVRDRNKEFLNSYGAGRFLVSGSSNEHQDSHGYIHYSRHWTHVAVPIVGKGQTVSSIIVEEGAANKSGTEFSGGVYSNDTIWGIPGGLISGGSATVPRKHPSQIVIPIHPTTLQNNTIYWIEEQLPFCGHCLNRDYWKANKKTKLKAYIQNHWYYATSSSGGYNWSDSSSTSWTPQSTGPFLKLR